MTGIFVMRHEKGCVHTPMPGRKNHHLLPDDARALRMPFLSPPFLKNPPASVNVPLSLTEKSATLME
jgi:hypothetical protein